MFAKVYMRETTCIRGILAASFYGRFKERKIRNTICLKSETTGRPAWRSYRHFATPVISPNKATKVVVTSKWLNTVLVARTLMHFYMHCSITPAFGANTWEGRVSSLIVHILIVVNFKDTHLYPRTFLRLLVTSSLPGLQES